MKRAFINAMRWLSIIPLTVWGMTAFIHLLGEDDPQKPLPLSIFFACKFGAIAALYMEYKVLAVLYRNGWFPSAVTRYVARIEEEED